MSLRGLLLQNKRKFSEIIVNKCISIRSIWLNSTASHSSLCLEQMFRKARFLTLDFHSHTLLLTSLCRYTSIMLITTVSQKVLQKVTEFFVVDFDSKNRIRATLILINH